MAQQGISTRELNIGGAAGRQVAQLNQQTGPDHSASNKQLRFVEQLTNIGDPLIKKMRQEEIQEAKIKDASDKKAKDEEAARLRVAAHKQLLATQGQDYKDAHSKTVNTRPDGQGGDKKVFAPKNPDVLNPIYKKEYELAFTTRKVEKFQKNLDLGAEKDIDEIYTVWEKLYKVPGSEFEGIPFDHVALTALTDRKDAYYAKHLQHLPHLGEVISQDKFKINYTAHEKAIAKKSQEFIDGERLKYLDDATHDFYVDRKYPKEKTKNGKTISAASDLFNQAEALQGKVITDKGMQGFYTKKEIHGAFIKQYSEQIFLAKSPDDPIFESINAIFDSPDAYRLLGLDPNDKNGTGSQYAALRAEADTRFLKLQKEAEDKNVNSDKNITKNHTNYLKKLDTKVRVTLSQDTITADQLGVIIAEYEDTSLWNQHKFEGINKLSESILVLKGKKVTTDQTPTTPKEAASIQKYKEDLLKIESRDELQDIKATLLLRTDISDREKNQNLINIKAHGERLKTKSEVRKTERDEFKENSADLKTSLSVKHKEETVDKKGKPIKSKDLVAGLEDYKKSVRSNIKLAKEDQEALIKERETLIKDRDQTEKDTVDKTTTKEFTDAITDIDPKKVTEANITSLQKILGKINSPTLQKELGFKINDLAEGIFSQEELEENSIKLKSANKAFSKLKERLNVIKELPSEKATIALSKLKDTLEAGAGGKIEGGFVEEFRTAVDNDPAKRDYRDMLSDLQGDIEKKKTTEVKEQEAKDKEDLIQKDEESRADLEQEAIQAVLKVKEDFSPDNYQDAVDKINLKTEVNQKDGTGPKNVFVIESSDRRFQYLQELDKLKVVSSGKVPSSKDLDPETFVAFQNDIEAIDDLPTGNQKREAINRELVELQFAFETFQLPESTYSDFYKLLKGKDPEGPPTIDPRDNGLKTISSIFQGKWGKFDTAEEFLPQGGRTGPQLYDKARRHFESWYTKWSNGEKFDDPTIKPYGSLNEVQKQEEAAKYADRILDYETDAGVMGDTFKKDLRTYDESWDDYMNRMKGKTTGNVPFATSEASEKDDSSKTGETSSMLKFSVGDLKISVGEKSSKYIVANKGKS